MKSDTPRTNQVLATNHYREPIEDLGFAIMVEHARQLERELNEALALIELHSNEIRTAIKERTRQQQILDALNKQ